MFYTMKLGRLLWEGENFQEEGGLRIIAVPWEYSLCSKMCRLAQEPDQLDQPQDIEDAAVYLFEFLRDAEMLSIGLHQEVLEGFLKLYKFDKRIRKSGGKSRLTKQVSPRLRDAFDVKFNGGQLRQNVGLILSDDSGEAKAAWFRKLSKVAKTASKFSPIVSLVGSITEVVVRTTMGT